VKLVIQADKLGQLCVASCEHVKHFCMTHHCLLCLAHVFMAHLLCSHHLLPLLTPVFGSLYSMDSKPDPMPSAPVMAQAVQAVLVEPDGYQAVPPATPQQSLKFPPTPIVGVHQMEHLYAEHKMTPGLCNAVVRTLNDFAVRIWVVDNSGSMATGDGNRIVTTSSGATKVVSCSRWDEIVDW